MTFFNDAIALASHIGGVVTSSIALGFDVLGALL